MHGVTNVYKSMCLTITLRSSPKGDTLGLCESQHAGKIFKTFTYTQTSSICEVDL